ncbi:uncharacterized protein LOC129957672 [Argiope bruennichi]|uniref:uncharacterized protein LOC129957672 n=1 Tax=Argiope bruennichi TaxID=94029 RepID=UPI0024951DCA|nr:uncharacterized protein LOC129957672 [Argiope bruennichi]XP_055926097.1 uncharacterized protein LOC129957672 [Argiope bruennichi]
MDFTNYETGSHVIKTTFEIKIEDFYSTSDLIGKEHRNPHPLVQSIYAAVYPNGVDADTEGWVVVLPDVDVSPGWNPENEMLSWIVSIIDNTGTPKIPRSFEECHFDGDFQHEKYLDKSFILSRADEFLAEGVLTLRCDIYFTWNDNRDDWSGCTYEYMKMKKEQLKLLNGFLHTIPKATVDTSAETGHSGEAYKIYDFTHRILTLPQFDEVRKAFGIYGIAPSFTRSRSKSKQNSPEIWDIWEHVWIFDIFPDRFFLLLDENQESVGSSLMKASPVLRRCLNTPMKEKRDKRIELYHVKSRAFLMILFFLEKGMLPPAQFDELVDVYKISHLYEMKELQQKCAQQLVKSLVFPTDFEELLRIAYLYSDEYLSTILDSSCVEDVCPFLFDWRLNIEDRLDFACYI